MTTKDELDIELPEETMEADNSAKQEAGGIGDVPQTVVKHKRGVSWDASSFSAKPVSAVSSGRLKGIQGATPMESEADTFLLQTLEEVDPISLGDVPTVLENVTKEEESVFQAPQTITAKEEASKSPFHRRKNTAENLWTLTHRLKSAHNVAHAESSSNTFDQEVPNGQADSLAANAAALLQRKRRESMKVQSEDTTAQQNINPAANWAKLRMAVDIASTVGTKKKTDEEQKEEQTSNDLEEGESGHNSGSGSYGKSSHAAAALTQKNKLAQAKDQVASDFHEFKTWLSFKRIGAFQYIRFMVLFIMIPSAAIAAILFYFGDNPPCGTQSECLRAQQSEPPTAAPVVDVNATQAPDDGAPDIEDIFGGGKFFGADSRYDSASVSWWLLFMGVRQVVTFMLARMTEAIVIDFLCLRTQWTPRILGPFIALFIVQSKGWPIRFIFWGIYDFALLYGAHKFPRHWCYWQDVIDLFNGNNPAGNVTSSENYRVILILMIACGGAVAAKRFYMGLELGKKTYSRYAQDLEKVMKKTLLLSEVAYLAKRIEKDNFAMTDDMGIQSDLFQVEETASASKDGSVADQSAKTQKSATTLGLQSLSGSNRFKIDQMLGAWEEPQETRADEESPDISSIIQFRQALSFLNTTHPFSIAFGLADTRETCVASSERVFNRLMISNPGREALNFDTLALITVNRDGSLDEPKLKELVKLVRPDRDGNLTLIDFCKSVDTVYKELRLLRASVASAARVDQAFERIVNIIFYFILGCIVLSVIGIDPFALFVAVSGIIVGFAFMIGAACSKYFEGLLMVLVRKPYDIGDRVNVCGPESESSSTGAPGWVVKDITLYHTTIVYGTTQEVATVSNGSIANSRIINATRSPQAVLNFLQKFPIDVPLKKVQIFQGAMEKFVKARPREWLSFLAFRPTRVEADGGFVEYIIVAQHRENWASIGALLTSKAELQSFCLEVSKKMGMRYIPPALPVDLNANFNPASMDSLNAVERPGTISASEEVDEEAYTKDVDEIAAMFAAAK